MKTVCTLAPDFLNSMAIPFPPQWSLEFVPYKSGALMSALEDADCWFVSSLQPVNEEKLQHAKRLRLVNTLGVGFNKIDLDYTRERGIYVCNGRGTNGRAVAEHAVSLMLAGLRRLTHYERLALSGQFQYALLDYGVQGFSELGTRKVGLIGLGETGSETARFLTAFGCEVYYYKRNRADAETERSLCVQYLPFETLLKTCDIISLHVPSSKETIGMIGEKEINMMRPDTLLINVARGEIIDTGALVSALETGRIFGAALDTTYPEPPGTDHPLLNLSENARLRLILTPHIAGVTRQSKEAAIKKLVANIRAVENGERPRNIVNGL
ncbi:NAD(P)-binding domain-containing protein [Christensenellaceae bacterium OttesenSCG-928-M15]|nr:NAD(P)-binding domain-containing protein [Christensenellaceae bacterium OttesenSCG-928-M15]